MNVFELDTEVFEYRGAAGHDGQVLQHRLAAVTVTGALDSDAFERAAELVDDQRGQSFALDILGNDQQRLAGVDDFFEDGDEVLDVGDFLFVDQHVGVFVDGFHRLRIGDEVRRQVASIELHAFELLAVGRQALAFLDGDHSILADLIHGVGEDLADLGVAVRGDGADLGDGLGRAATGGHLAEVFDNVFDRLVHALFHLDRADSGDDGLETFVVDGFGHDRRGRGAVTGDVGRLAGDFLDHPSTHVLELVTQLDLSSHRDAVLGHRRRSETLFQNHVAAAWPQGDSDCSSQFADSTSHRFLGVLVEGKHLCHGSITPLRGCL